MTAGLEMDRDWFGGEGRGREGKGGEGRGREGKVGEGGRGERLEGGCFTP